MKVLEAVACPEHIRLFVEIPPKLSESGFMGYLKGKSAAMMYEQFGELKYKYCSKEFRRKGYYEKVRAMSHTFCLSADPSFMFLCIMLQ